ncbi:MucBP domain-containing protein [Isobaculum melis]|uniref:LPXTG-motif cell wall anchor domain-containing protein n=1 Tax=Isobaculum melis TaxID=142588 RepID=A0A1H9TLQ0_9LACT|nr:MucBP domain-containing protein [Isobaculum melis]SER98052.1 LPXTG-motif cell wall anchor domain-containing protein [Isobaculum melis]
MNKKILLFTTFLLLAGTIMPVLATETTPETRAEVTPPTDDLRHVSNMFVDPGHKYIAYNGAGELDLFLYSSQKTQYLSNMYVILPQGLTTSGGIDAVQNAVSKYSTGLNIHNGSLSVTQLANTTDGREVYQISPSTGAFITAGGHDEFLALEFPVKAASKDSGLTKVTFNANTLAEIGRNVLFIGADNIKFDTSVSSYPEVNATTIGINGADSIVRGIVLNGIQREITLFTPKVSDTYTVYDNATNEVITTKTSTGLSGEQYSRIGLVDTLASLGLDASIYDEKSLTIDSGSFSDSIEWVPQKALTNNPDEILSGSNYRIFVKRFGKDVTVKYVDENNNEIADSITLSGNIDDGYTSEQKAITGYTFKEVQGNTTGTFTDDEQIITYIYTKDIVKAAPVTVHYVDTEGQKLAEDIVLDGNVGERYETEQLTFNHYDFKEVEGSISGEFIDKEQEVTYIYAKIEENIVIPPSENNEPPKKQEEAASIARLPETGEKNRSFIGYGLILVLIASFLIVNRKNFLKNE